MACSRLMLLLSVTALTVADAVLLRSGSPAHIPQFTAPALSPKQFLIISSPSEKKVVWTTLKNMETSEGRPFALIDTGLTEPRGIAFDHKKGHLYIADRGAQKIFRYTVLVCHKQTTPKLITSGIRLTITQGHPVESVTIDQYGDLFYTAPDTNNINKIQAAVMDKIAKGEFDPRALTIVSEKTLEATQAAEMALAKTRATQSNQLPVDPPNVKAHIYSMYEAKLNPHVSAPASLWADGSDLYWTNLQNGETAGSVVKGEIDPKSATSQNGTAPFPAVAITNASGGAYGLSNTKKVTFFTRNGSLPNTGAVTGLMHGANLMIDFVQSIQKPRGLIFDMEQTMYVADEGLGAVWSFPVGVFMKNAPITKTVSMKGAYGLVILHSNDPAFDSNSVSLEDDAPSEGTPLSQKSSLADVAVHDAQQADVSFLQDSESFRFRSCAYGVQSALRSLVAVVGIVALVA